MAQNPENLLLLFLLFPLAGLFWWAWQADRRDRQALGDDRLISALLRSVTRRFRWTRAILQIGAFALIVIALSRPAWGQGDETLKRSGLQILILQDGSRSMAAQDIPPSRIEASKNVILELLERMQGNQIGMLMFGSTSYVQFPLTTDVIAAQSLVKPISAQNLSLGGTDLAGVIVDGQRSFALGQIEGRTMILISDGGDPDPERDAEAIAAAREASKVGLTIYTIGMATDAGAPIPQYDGDGFNSGYIEKDGQRVESKLNRPVLEQIASATGGLYFDGNKLNLDQLQEQLERSAPVSLEDQTRRVRTERFYLFAGTALLLLLADAFLGRQQKVAK